MVKPPPLRTAKSIGFKVSEEEYAVLLKRRRVASRQTLGRVVPRGDPAGRSASDDPALAEIIGVRLLLVNVLGPVAAGEKVTPEKFNQTAGSDQRSQAPARPPSCSSRRARNTQREKPSAAASGESHFSAGECTERMGAASSLPLRSDRWGGAHQERAGLTRLPLSAPCVASS